MWYIFLKRLERKLIMSKLAIAICQMQVENDLDTNLGTAEKMIDQAYRSGAELVVLPEVFHGPYQSELFPRIAEPHPGPSTDLLSRKAGQHGICIVGGSIIERDHDGYLYNSSFVFGPNGELLARHRKAHLFDVNIPGKVAFQESSALQAGNVCTLVNYRDFCFAVMICFDARFPEFARTAALNGAQMLIIPAAFSVATGSAHWDVLMRSRAIDNQVYVVAASPARNPASTYQAWGYSMIIDPWGQVLQQADTGQELLTASIDLDTVEQIRLEMPLFSQRRPELYVK